MNNTATESTPAAANLLARIGDSRRLAAQWLTDRVASDGRPEGADVANLWWRAPWALCVGGAPEVAALMMGWIEREALGDAGELRPGPSSPRPPSSSVYFLSPVAIAAWLLGRYDTANAVNDCLRRFQDPQTGGAYEYENFDADPLQDTLSTSQLGVSALVTGDRATADGVYRWLTTNYAEQPELPQRLFTSRRDGTLVTEFPEADAFTRMVDFDAARQAYFQPGIAAAFLAGYSQQTGDTAALQLGRDYLTLTTGGSEIQFTDPTSVQICKFGWGAAAMMTADPHGGHRTWVELMANWFCDRQRPDGTWAPSSFMAPEPTVLDLYWKTAEHLMELSYIEFALKGAAATDKMEVSR